MSHTYNKRSLRLALPATLFAMLLLAGCQPDTRESILGKASSYQSKGDLNAAVIVLKTALEANPKDGEMRLALARVYLDQGDPISAEKEIRLAMAREQPVAATLPVLGRALNLQGKYQASLDETQREVGSRAPELLCLRGDAYLALNRPIDARQLYQTVLDSDPKYALALIGMGRLAFLERNQAEANRYAQLALASSANNIEALMFYGDLLRAENKSAEALATYDKVIAINPVHRTAHVEKAYLDIGIGDYPAATRELVAARKIAPGSLLVAYSQALLDFSEGKNEEAQDHIRTVLRVAPEHMPSLLLAGAAALKLGSFHQAEHFLRQYLEKHPDNVYARKMLAQSLIKRGNSPAALEVLAPALKKGVEDVQLLALAGESYMQAANYDQAGLFFQRASALDPKAANLRMSLAMSKLGKGDTADAVSDLQMATQLDRKSPAAGMALIRTELNLGHFDKALEAADALAKTQPNNAAVLDLKGQAYVGKKDLTAARAAFDAALKVQPSYFQSAANLAQLDLRDDKPDAAAARVKAFLAANPNSVDAMSALATMAAAQNRTQETTDWLVKAAAVDPAAVTPTVNLISHYLVQKQNQKALDLALQLKVAHPDNPDLLDLMGKAQLANNDFDAATDSFRKLTVALPRSAQAQMQLAAILIITKKDAAAEEALKAALSMQPDFPAAQVALVEVYARKGWLDLALQICDKMQRTHPESPAGFQLAGDILMMDKKPALALVPFEHVFSKLNDSESLMKAATAQRANGQKDAAARRLTAWLAQHPKDLRIELLRAENSLSDKQYSTAMAQFESILSRYPQQPVALNNLAMAYHFAGDKRAVPTAEKAYLAAGEKPDVMDTLGWILIEQGDLSRGLPILLRASQLAPQAGDIRLHVAQGLYKSGDKAAARKELDVISKTDARFAQADGVKDLLKQLQ